MGNTLQNYGLPILNPEQWQSVPNYPRVMVSRITNETALMQCYKHIDDELIKSWAFRASNSKYLINVVGLMNTYNFSSCSINKNSVHASSNSQQSAVVLIQNVQFVLTDLGALDFASATYILKQCLEGLKLIAHQYGNEILNQIILQQQMIVVNQSGQCKIWLDSNYFSNIGNARRVNSKQNPEQGNLDCLNLNEQLKILQQLFLIIQTKMNSEINQIQRNYYFSQKKALMQFEGKIVYSFKNTLQFIDKISRFQNLNLSAFRLLIPSAFQEDICHGINKLPNNKIQKVSTQNVKFSRRAKISLKFLLQNKMLIDKIQRHDNFLGWSPFESTSFSTSKKKVESKTLNRTQCKKFRKQSPMKVSRTTFDSQNEGKLSLPFNNKNTFGISVKKKALF